MRREDLIADLRVQIGGERSALVIGAGVSILATGQDQRASWVGLLQDGAEAAAEGDAPWLHSVRARLAAGTVDELFPVADEVVAKLTAHGSQVGGLRRWLAKSVGSLEARAPDVLHRLLALDRPLITTNYDSLLEDTRGDGRYVTWEQFPEFQQVLRGDSKSIVHLHGHWRDPDSVLLSRASYTRKVEHRVRELQRSLMLSHSLVFVGVGEGIRDPDLSELIAWASTTTRDSSYTHYRLCRTSEVDQLRRQHQYDNIEVVAYGDDYGDLPGFLHKLAPAPAPRSGSHRPGRRKARVSDLDESVIDEYAERRGLDPRLGLDAKLEALSLVDEDGDLFDWSLLCFAHDPGSFYPGADLKLINATSQSVTNIDGPLSMQVSEGMRALRQLVELPHLDDAAMELFHRALREAISNAVVHRDYDRGGSTRIVIGPESVKIHNPGSLPASIDRSNVLAGVSQPSDRHRARALQYLNAAEGAGLGFESFREFGEVLGARFPGAQVTVVEEPEQVTTTLTVPIPPAYLVADRNEGRPEKDSGPRESEQEGETDAAPYTGGRPPHLLPAASTRSRDGLTWSRWLETLDERTRGLTANDLLIVPQKLTAAEPSKGWSRHQRDDSARPLAEVLAIKPLRAIISAGALDYDSMFAVIVAALWESGRHTGLVWEEDVDESTLEFLVPDTAAPLPIVVSGEPDRAYHPIADVSDEFILLTTESTKTLPVGVDALFWRFDRLRESAVSSRLGPVATGELKMDAPAAAVLKQLMVTPEDVAAVNAAVRPLGKGSSVEDMLASVEKGAGRIGLDMAPLRSIVEYAYPWAFPKDGKAVNLTTETIDRWASERESRFRKGSAIASVSVGLLIGAFFSYVLHTPVVSAALFGAWSALTLLAGLLARVRVDIVPAVAWHWGLVPFVAIQTGFSLVLRFTFGVDLPLVLGTLAGTSLVYSVCRLIGHVRVHSLLGDLTRDVFYPAARAAGPVLDGAARLRIVERFASGGSMKTPDGRTVEGVKYSYVISSATVFSWLTRPTS